MAVVTPSLSRKLIYRQVIKNLNKVNGFCHKAYHKQGLTSRKSEGLKLQAQDLKLRDANPTTS